jgi:predicted dehydrogenase
MTYRTGLLGLSGIGTRHRDGYAATDGVELTAIADIDDDLVERRGAAWGISEDHRYTDHTELLAAEDLDAVSVATPSSLHRDHVLDAVASVADPDVVWCEKPIAESVADAEEMCAACDDADVDLLIDHTRRFSSSYQTLHEAITGAEVVGGVQSVHVQSPAELLQNGTHMVDLLVYLLGERVTEVMGRLTGASGGEWDDTGGGGVMITDDGTYVNIDCTTSRETTSGQWLLVGDEGKVEFSEYGDSVQYWRLEDSAEGSYGTEHVPAALPDPLDGFDDPEAWFEAGAANVRGLLEGTEANRSPGEVATHVLETIVGLFVSHYTGARVDLPLAEPMRDATVRSR